MNKLSEIKMIGGTVSLAYQELSQRIVVKIMIISKISFILNLKCANTVKTHFLL